MNSDTPKNAADYGRATSPATLFTIAIGGNIVSRGVTFDSRLRTFFTRDVKHKIQQDTYIQRARMFGTRGIYRKYFELHIPESLYFDWQKCLALLGRDERLQAVIRKELAKSTRLPSEKARRPKENNPVVELARLSEARRKLLDLYYANKISADGFQEEELRLCVAIEAAREEAAEGQREERLKSDLELRFEQVASILTTLDIDAVWNAAEEHERRIMIEELVEWVRVFPDHLEVKVSATPPLNVLFSEVGLMGSDFVGVGGPTQQFCTLPLAFGCLGFVSEDRPAQSPIGGFKVGVRLGVTPTIDSRNKVRERQNGEG